MPVGGTSMKQFGQTGRGRSANGVGRAVFGARGARGEDARFARAGAAATTTGAVAGTWRSQ